jgi:hypothetical protein
VPATRDEGRRGSAPLALIEYARKDFTLSAVSIREDLGSDSDGVSDLELSNLGSDLGDFADDLVSLREKKRYKKKRVEVSITQNESLAQR